MGFTLGWQVGITLFYHSRPEYETRNQKRYLDTPKGLVKMEMSNEEIANVKAVYHEWTIKFIL